MELAMLFTLYWYDSVLSSQSSPFLLCCSPIMPMGLGLEGLFVILSESTMIYCGSQNLGRHCGVDVCPPGTRRSPR